MATITKRGKVWYVQVRRQGVNKRGTFATKGQASAWATKVEADILNGIAQNNDDKRLIDALERYAAEVSPTKKGARWELVRLEKFKRMPFAYWKLSEVTTATLAEWRDQSLKKIQPSSVNRELNLLSSVFELARVEWQWIRANPVHDVRRPANPKHRERLFTDDERDAICRELGYVEGFPVETKRQITALAFLFALETAMRREEIIGLEWKAIFIKRRFLSLQTSKNDDGRMVPLSPRAVEILEKLKGFSRPFEVNIDSVSTEFRRACIRAKVADAKFHDSRATALTRLVRDYDYDVIELARIVGHRDPRSLMIYYRETAENLAGKMWVTAGEKGPEDTPAAPALRLVK